MSKIRSKNTKPEMLVRSLLFSMGTRYRLHCKDLPGSPDLVFRSKKKVIFVNGCFWHGHFCRHKMPIQNSEYWQKKIQRNQERDLNNYDALIRLGWKYLVIWECEMKDINALKEKLDSYLNSSICNKY